MAGRAQRALRSIIGQHTTRPASNIRNSNRRIAPEYVDFLRDIGASDGLVTFAAGHVDAGAPSNARRGVRGQAMVEFALVMPVLFAVIFAFILLATFTFDGSVLNHAAVSGTRAGNDAMAIVNAQVTKTSNPNILMMLTPYPFRANSGTRYGRDLSNTTQYLYGASTDPSTATGCLKIRNEASPRGATKKAAVNTNTAVLGWDWGSRGCGIVSDATLAAPLRAAASATHNVIGGLLLGPRTVIQVTACYANAAGNCVMSVVLTANGSSAPSFSTSYTSGINFRTQAAPSFIKIDTRVTVLSLVDIPLVSGMGVPGSLVMRAQAVEVLDRFLPACPAYTGAGVPPAGSCGALY